MKSLKIQLISQLKNQKKPLTSIFFGGGTPTTVDANLYEDIFEVLYPFIDNDTEITSEANPNSATFSWLESMYKMGLTRVSFGVQSFNDEKAKFLGRAHSKDDSILAIENAHKVGFENISCDIIYDTFGDTKKIINNDLDIIKSLPLNHVSAYSLTIEEGTKFFNQKNVKIDDVDMSRYIFEKLDKIGFSQYEISNFAKNEDARSKHNIGYWVGKEYYGVGAGAVGYQNKKRYYPLKDVQSYIDNPLKFELIESLSQDDIKTETVLLGLRAYMGIDMQIFTKTELKKIEILENENKIIIKSNRIYNLDYLLSDEIALYILD